VRHFTRPANSLAKPTTQETSEPSKAHTINQSYYHPYQPSITIMSSYSEVASHGPQQSASEKAANTVESLVDHSAKPSKTADVGHSVNVVDSGFKDQDIKTETQAKGREVEAKTQELEQEAKDKAQRAEKKVKEEAGKAKEGAKKAGRKAENALIAAGQDDRTYQILNAVLFASLGFVGYQRYQAGRLDWTHVGLGALGLGLLVGVEGQVQRWMQGQSTHH
jgi:hypothetical protein